MKYDDLANRLKDPLNAPAFDKDCYPRCTEDRADVRYPLSRKLLYKSHWPLDLTVDIDQSIIEMELSRLDNTWNGFDNDPLQERGAGISTYWTAKFLRNFVEDSNFGFTDSEKLLTKMGRADDVEKSGGHCKREKLVNTDIWDKVPYIRSIAERYVTIEKSNRIAISRVDEFSRVNWHSHIKETKSASYTYLHIPLVTHKDANMLVLKDGMVDYQHYDIGESWLFNTQHNHAVNCRKSDVKRIHLLILASFDDPKFINHLELSLRQYKDYSPSSFHI